MIIIDGSFLVGVAAILTSIATLWRSMGEWKAEGGRAQQEHESMRVMKK